MLLCPLFRLQETFQECRDGGYITEREQPFVEIGLKVGLGDVQAGDTERHNYNKAGKNKSKPFQKSYFDRAGAAIAIKYYCSEQQQC